MPDPHDWRLMGGGGGWDVVECSRCGLSGFGGAWWQRLLTWVWPTRYGCDHRTMAAESGSNEQVQ